MNNNILYISSAINFNLNNVNISIVGCNFNNNSNNATVTSPLIG